MHRDIPLLNLKFNCEYCHDSGQILVTRTSNKDVKVYGEPTFLEWAEPCPYCNCKEVIKLQQAKEVSNIPNSYYDKLISDFSWNEYIVNGEPVDMSVKQKTVMDFIENFREWEKQGLGFYFVSRTKGSGKTMLSSCICNELMQRYGFRTKFINCSELINYSKSYNAKTEVDPINILCECKVLVLDDIGQKSTNVEWLTDLLYRIIEARYQHKLVTIVTSNAALQDLQLDDRIYSRLDAMTCKLTLPDVPFRQKEATSTKVDFFKSRGLMEGEPSEKFKQAQQEETIAQTAGA